MDLVKKIHSWEYEMEEKASVPTFYLVIPLYL